MVTIYVIRNYINEKVYVGKSTQSALKRLSKHFYQLRAKNKCTCLYKAITELGKENFYTEELLVGDFNKECADELEMVYIKKFNSIHPLGYNLQTGGISPKNHPESNAKTSNTLKGRLITWNDQISETMSTKWADPVYRAEMVAKHTGKRGYKYKKHTKPKRLNLDQEYILKLRSEGNSIYKIAKLMSVCFSSIKNRL